MSDVLGTDCANYVKFIKREGTLDIVGSGQHKLYGFVESVLEYLPIGVFMSIMIEDLK